MLDAALGIAKQYGPIIPVCYPDDAGACACGGRHAGHDIGKAPIGKLVRNGVDNATQDTATITRWWTQHPDANVGLALEPARLLVVDPDSDEALADARNRGLPTTTTRESRMKAYVYARPDECPTENVIKYGPSNALDILTKGYLVVAGRHAQGFDVVLNGQVEPSASPLWAVAAVQETALHRVPATRIDASDEPPVRLSGKALDRWNGVTKLKDRSDPLFAIACDLARANASRSTIVTALLERDVTLGWNKAHERNDPEKWCATTADNALAEVDKGNGGDRLSLDDFWAYSPRREFIYVPDGKLWIARSVDDRVDPVGREKASDWLAKRRAVTAMTWAPGEPEIIEGRSVEESGWRSALTLRTYNQYRAPVYDLSSAGSAELWLEFLTALYSRDSAHMEKWFAHRVQRPGQKVNHGLLLGGGQGIGKDTLLAPVKWAIGEYNCHSVSPSTVMGPFNGFAKSVLLCVEEARDLGESTRRTFYDHMKHYLAAPPHMLRVNEKNKPEYYIPNVCGVVYTTNYRTGGMQLADDDRRHYVAWSDAGRDDALCARMWAWYWAGGFEAVAAHLLRVDLKNFDPYAPPPKTDAFHAIVGADTPPELLALLDVLEQLGTPVVVTSQQIVDVLEGGPGVRVLTNERAALLAWLRDRRNSRLVSVRFEQAGYRRLENPNASDHRWRVGPDKMTIYRHKDATDNVVRPVLIGLGVRGV